jgi:glutaminase
MDGAINEQTDERPREWRLFFSLDDDGDGFVTRVDLRAALDASGLSRSDLRLGELHAALDELEREDLDLETFLSVIGPAGIVVERALQGALAIPDFSDFSERVEKLFRETATNEGGEQPSYIAPLLEVEANKFGAAIVTVDGQILELGDTADDFSIQSTCKPFNYLFALEELGADAVHKHIGMEPSGRAFNARRLMVDGTERPHNPMINAGAIMTAALMKRDLPVHRRLEHAREMWAKLTGGPPPRFNAWMAQEELRTGDTNRSLAYMMKAAGVMPGGEDAVDHDLRDALELYFGTCSLEMTALEMARAAATLANGGVCTTTHERVLKRINVRHCLSLMQMCGMYDGSGEFCFHIGLPAKSGVGGGLLLVVPGLMGICIWSPRLNANGNTVRGVELATRLVETFRLHLYDGLMSPAERIDPRLPVARWQASLTSEALWAASIGDVRSIRRLHDGRVNLQAGDYDQRSPMHLAAAEGHLQVLEFLLEQGVNPNQPDRWGGLPLDDAVFGGHEACKDLLVRHGARQGEIKHISSDGPREASADHGDGDAVAELLWAASNGDVTGLRRLVAQGVPVSAADYDGRTSLHLAAAENKLEAVRYLIAHGHPMNVRDRWNATPLDEARRERAEEVTQYIETIR